MTNRRIVITGMGALTPLGNSVEETWEGMKNGRSGIGKIEGCDDSALNIHIAGEVRGYDPAPHLSPGRDGARTTPAASSSSGV